jgi:replicative DNA helicase
MTRKSSQQPPHDPLAEQCVIGALLLNNSLIPDVIKVITATDFYRPNHQSIYSALIDMFTKGEPADPVTVGGELERRGELTKVGGAKALVEMITIVQTAVHAVS